MLFSPFVASDCPFRSTREFSFSSLGGATIFVEVAVENCENSKNRRKRLCAPLSIDSRKILTKVYLTGLGGANTDVHLYNLFSVGRCFALAIVSSHKKTRSSADTDKPARRVWRSVKVTKHSVIPYIRYTFLLRNSNFDFKTDIRLQKCRDLEIWIRGHSRSLKVVLFDRLCMVSY